LHFIRLSFDISIGAVERPGAIAGKGGSGARYPAIQKQALSFLQWLQIGNLL
jgi:hypothetical protein